MCVRNTNFGFPPEVDIALPGGKVLFPLQWANSLLIVYSSTENGTWSAKRALVSPEGTVNRPGKDAWSVSLWVKDESFFSGIGGKPDFWADSQTPNKGWKRQRCSPHVGNVTWELKTYVSTRSVTYFLWKREISLGFDHARDRFNFLNFVIFVFIELLTSLCFEVHACNTTCVCSLP